MSGNRAVIGFAKIDEAIIVRKTVIHLSPEAFDFIHRHTDRSKETTTGWKASKVDFSIMSSATSTSEFYDAENSRTGGRRLFLKDTQTRGKRFILEEVIRKADVETFSDKDRADLEVALKELADAIRAEEQVKKPFDSDLQAF
jgi:hypothetical protein